MRPFPDASGAVAKPRRGKQRSFLFFQGEKSFCLSNSVHSTRKKNDQGSTTACHEKKPGEPRLPAFLLLTCLRYLPQILRDLESPLLRSAKGAFSTVTP